MSGLLHDIELDVVAQAAAVLGPLGVKAEAFPEKPEEIVLTHPKGQVLVVLKDAQFGPSAASDLIAQPLDLVFDLTIVVKGLRYQGGAYAVLDGLRTGFTGWTGPHHAGKARLRGWRFIGQRESVWVYSLELLVRAMNIEAVPAETGPSITKLTYSANGHTIEVTP